MVADSLPRVVIRCDGGTDIGMGHVIRCIALADMISKNHTICFAIQKTSDHVYQTLRSAGFDYVLLPTEKDYVQDLENLKKEIDSHDVVVLDGYNFRTDYQRGIKVQGNKLVVIDDLHAWRHVADIVINHAGGVSKEDYDCESYTKLLLGFRFALLRKEFLGLIGQSKIRSELKTAFISMGAADIHGLTLKFAEALKASGQIQRVDLMVSELNPHYSPIIHYAKANSESVFVHTNITAEELIGILSRADIAFCPASTISLECCAVGIGLIVGYTAVNQAGIYDGLIKEKVAAGFGDMNLTEQEIRIRLNDMLSGTVNFEEIIKTQQLLFDGFSGQRINHQFRQLIVKDGAGLFLRRAIKSDVDLYFRWASDPEVRKQSFNQGTIDYDDHVRWFSNRLQDQNTQLYLFEDEAGSVVGQLRFQIIDKEHVVGINVDAAHRGRGYAPEIIRLGTSDFLKHHPNVIPVAYIKKENEASYRSFLSAGYSLNSEIVQEGLMVYKLNYLIKTDFDGRN